MATFLLCPHMAFTPWVCNASVYSFYFMDTRHTPFIMWAPTFIISFILSYLPKGLIFKHSHIESESLKLEIWEGHNSVYNTTEMFEVGK